tara:strand:- start:87536 stop:88177 length:642 start_codon:yes stop_codon:yes gene_type:complete
MSYKQQFIEFCLAKDVLRFGEFTLKSGRTSPYFFNSGLFNTGEDLAILGGFYAAAIADANPEFDVLFGPAYKGIPLVCATAIGLASNQANNKPYCFNRKETKDHSEGGNLVGADIKNKNVLIIDDVITAGTAIREAMDILDANQANLAGVVISMNRQERGKGEQSAIQEIEENFNTKVHSIIDLQDLIDYLAQDKSKVDALKQMQAYRQEFGV